MLYYDKIDAPKGFILIKQVHQKSVICVTTSTF